MDVERKKQKKEWREERTAKEYKEQDKKKKKVGFKNERKVMKCQGGKKGNSNEVKEKCVRNVRN